MKSWQNILIFAWRHGKYLYFPSKVCMTCMSSSNLTLFLYFYSSLSSSSYILNKWMSLWIVFRLSKSDKYYNVPWKMIPLSWISIARYLITKTLVFKNQELRVSSLKCVIDKINETIITFLTETTERFTLDFILNLTLNSQEKYKLFTHSIGCEVRDVSYGEKRGSKDTPRRM